MCYVLPAGERNLSAWLPSPSVGNACRHTCDWILDAPVISSYTSDVLSCGSIERDTCPFGSGRITCILCGPGCMRASLARELNIIDLPVPSSIIAVVTARSNFGSRLGSSQLTIREANPGICPDAWQMHDFRPRVSVVVLDSHQFPRDSERSYSGY